jgi:hypothetical protein
MALTYAVTKTSVTKTLEQQWAINLTLTVLNDGVEAFSKQFTIDYKPGVNVTAVMQGIKADMQKAIDDYKAEQTLYNNALLNQAVTWLNENLTV